VHYQRSHAFLVWTGFGSTAENGATDFVLRSSSSMGIWAFFCLVFCLAFCVDHFTQNFLRLTVSDEKYFAKP